MAATEDEMNDITTINPGAGEFWEFVMKYLAAGFDPLGPQGSSNPEYKTLEAYLRQIFGPLPEGAVDWASSDLNGDGVNDLYAVDADGNPHTIYGYNDGKATTTSYADWSAPDLSELIEKYGEDAVNDLKGKYDELVDFIGNIPEDPLGSIKKMAEVFIEGATGISPDCQKQTTGTETELETWILDCVNMGILVDIGIPSLPGLGGIFKSTTLRDIKNTAEEIGSTLEDFINGDLNCTTKQEDGTEVETDCTPELILNKIGDWVVGAVEDIFGDAKGEIDIESILGKLGGIFGPVLSGIIYDQFKDLINGEIENTIGVPVIPFKALDDCTKKGLETIKADDGSLVCGECTGVSEDGTPFVFNQDTGVCEDPTIVEDFDCSTVGKQGGIVQAGTEKQDENCGECLEGYEEDANGNCIEKEVPPECEGPTAEECTKLHKEHLPCTDLEDASCGECLEGYTENDQGVCIKEGDATPTGPDGIKCEDGYPEGSLTFALQDQQTWWKGNCKDTHCNDGTKIPESGVCEGEGGNGPDDLCDDGSEPFYINFDDDKDGAFTDPRDGKSYTYDPCDQTKPPVEVDPEGNDPDDGGFVVKCKEPKLGFTPSFDLELNAAYAAYSAKYDDECGTGEPPVDPTEPCPDFNGVEGPRDAEGNCLDCTDPLHALACGWAECPDGLTFAPTLEDCGTGTTPCDQQDRVTNEDGSCGECKPGFIEDPEGFDQCIQAPPECNDCTCAEYAADNPKECTTCPEGQSYCDSTGQCETAENCPDGTEPPPETGGGGGGGGGGMFDPFVAGITYTKQVVPEPPAPPQKDYMAELDNIIKRSLFEGMA